MHLTQFLKRFPNMNGKLTLATPQGGALDASPNPVAGYVAPTLTESTWPPGASVVLVEAPGAVGKTAAAVAIADALNWPIVFAEKAQVGSYSLSGLIQDAMGFGNPFIADVSAGRAGVVVDSLDEAHFRAGTENFLAFIDNVTKVSGADSESTDRAPSIILMSRSDTAELVRLAFMDAHVPLAEVRLDFFDLNGARNFIKAYMAQRFTETGRTEYNMPLASPGPFERLRDSRMKQVASVLLRRTDTDLARAWNEVRDFLGYTPVLVALAESLAVKNPAAERAALTAEGQSNLLREIIEHISHREQRKFSEHMRPKLHALLPPQVDAEIAASSMYLPEEQCARLMAFVSGEELAMPLPAALPDAVRSTYEEAVRTFLPDHPFVKGRRFASVVFGDFITAAACRTLEVRASLAGQPEDGIQSVGPFFARFLSDGNLDDEDAEIRESLVEHVVESWTQEADLVRTRDSEVLLSLVDGGGALTCRREAKAGHNEASELSFSISDVSGAIHIKRPLKRTTIVTDQGVIVGEPNKHTLLGPQVTVLANELIIEAETMRVDNERGRSPGVALASDAMTANYLQKVEAGPKDLHVFSADAPPRLRPWSRVLQGGGTWIPFQRYMDLRTILTAFRPSTKGSLSVLAAKLDGKIVKSNAHRSKILDELIESGVVSRSSSWYYLDLTSMGELGFGLQDLKTGEPGEAVLQFLNRCTVSTRAD